jgi:hypothetical protein
LVGVQRALVGQPHHQFAVLLTRVLDHLLDADGARISVLARRAEAIVATHDSEQPRTELGHFRHDRLSAIALEPTPGERVSGLGQVD